MKKKLSIIASLMMFFSVVTPSFAHVVVRPNEVGVASRQNFTISVPTEEDVPTIGLRLIIPEGLRSVRPNVKPGWEITLTKSGEGEESKITEIIWSGGSIPAEQRDEFVFSAQAPESEGTLVWKAYQTYAGGKIVAWDQDPKTVEEYSKNNPTPLPGEHDENAPNPFSVTNVVNDLSATDTTVASETNTNSNTNLLLLLSGGALILSVAALYMQWKKN